MYFLKFVYLVCLQLTLVNVALHTPYNISSSTAPGLWLAEWLHGKRSTFPSIEPPLTIIVWLQACICAHILLRSGTAKLFTRNKIKLTFQSSKMWSFSPEYVCPSSKLANCLLTVSVSIWWCWVSHYSIRLWMWTFLELQTEASYCPRKC